MSKQEDPLPKKLDLLAEKLDVLTMLLAAKPNSEQVNNLLKNKNQKEQVRVLREFGFPPREMALLIGTTLNNLRKTISEMESKKQDKQQKQQEATSSKEAVQ